MTGDEVQRIRRRLELTQAELAIQPAVDAEITVGAYAERWLGLIGPSLKPRSLAGYREKLDNHLLPALRDVRIRQLRRGRIKKLLADKLATGLSANTVRLIHASLRALLNSAVILASPAQGFGRTLRRRPTDSCLEPGRSGSEADATVVWHTATRPTLSSRLGPCCALASGRALVSDVTRQMG